MIDDSRGNLLHRHPPLFHLQLRGVATPNINKRVNHKTEV